MLDPIRVLIIDDCAPLRKGIQSELGRIQATLWALENGLGEKNWVRRK